MRIALLLLPILLVVGPAVGQDRVDFRSFVEKRLASKKLDLASICPIDENVVARRVFKDYGAMFVATWDVHPPVKCVFTGEDEVAAFQSGVKTKTLTIGNRTIELQAAAMDDLIKARASAAKRGLSITPRGATAARRGYADTLRIWTSRFEPALKHWVARGRIKAADADEARKMETIDQVARVIEWEQDSIWFSTGFNRSIFSSVAAPGTSQHLSMLALDVAEFGNRDVRAILNQHGWFQTIIDDTPHFTYLGLDEKDLPKRGLISETRDGFTFWIPNFER
jgi:hypothetical protein